MVDQPQPWPQSGRGTLEVLELRPPEPPAWSPRSQALLEALTALLHMPPELAVQVALTHTLSSLQRRHPIDVMLPFGDVADHKQGRDDV